MPSRPPRRSPRSPLAALLVVTLLVVAACTGDQPSAPPATSGTPATPGPTPAGSAGATDPPATPPVGELRVTLEAFAEVPNSPLAIAAPEDGTGRLFVASQAGQIWSVTADGAVGDRPMVDISGRLRSGGEQGLLGLALHPEFPADPRLFVNYTDSNGDTVIASLEVDPDDPDRIDPESHRQLLFIEQPYGNHNGGGVLFGPDGYLYLALGDGGAGGDPHGFGQRLDTHLGKILRIDIDADGRDFRVPDDNPFANADGFDEIWHTGLRNPWRLSFDRETGDLWIGDVGQGEWEEIDVARAGDGPLNFGWSLMEGAHCFGGDGCNREGLTEPVTEYDHSLGCTVIGGHVYRGAAYPFLVGTYLFADYCSGVIFAIDSTTTELVEPAQVGQEGSNISAFGEDANGELYATSLGGTVYRVIATAE